MLKNAAIRSGSNRGLLILGLFMALVTAGLIAYFLSQADKGGGGTYSGATVPVVVAKSDIPALARITDGMITVKEMPADVVLPGAFAAADKVVGQVTQVPIVAGEQIIPNKVTATGGALATFGENAPLSFTIPEGKRAFSVAVSEAAAAGGLIRAGDFVDIILSGTKPVPQDQQQQQQPQSESLASGAACYVVQDVEVLAIGQHTKPVGTEQDPSGISNAEADVKAVSATLAVTPDQVWRLAAAQESLSGSGGVGTPLWIALRPFGERGDVGSLPGCNVTSGS